MGPFSTEAPTEAVGFAVSGLSARDASRIGPAAWSGRPADSFIPLGAAWEGLAGVALSGFIAGFSAATALLASPSSRFLLAATFLTELFLVAAFLTELFLVAAFLAVVFLAVVFLAAVFLAVVFLAAVFLAAVFLAAVFLAPAFRAAVFAATFFLAAFFLIMIFFEVSYAAFQANPARSKLEALSESQGLSQAKALSDQSPLTKQSQIRSTHIHEAHCENDGCNKRLKGPNGSGSMSPRKRPGLHAGSRCRRNRFRPLS